MPRQLRRKEDVPDDARTPQKDAAAEFIKREVIAKDRWPMEYTGLAELSKERREDGGWSRQHFSNVVDIYFEEVTEREALGEQFDSLFDAYTQGFRDGWRERGEEADTNL